MNQEPSRRPLMPAALLAGLLLIAAAPITKEMSPDIAMPILGRTVYSPKGDTVGRVTDVLVDAAGIPQAAVLDVGGFLGVGNRIIAVHWASLHFQPSDKDHSITIDMPADEIAAAPQYTDTTAPAQVVVPHAPATATPAIVATPLPAGTSPTTPPAPAPPAHAAASTSPAPAPEQAGAAGATGAKK
jgi:PRC-barrel domain